MHDEGHIRLALWRKDSGRGKARVIDEERIAIPCPFDRVWWIRYDEFKGFIIPMLRTDQRIFTGDVEFIEANIMQEHIDAAQVVRRDIDFLPIEAITNGVLPQHLFGFQKERSAPTCRIIHLVDFCLPDRPQAGQELRHIGGCEEFATGFPCIRRIHGHEVLVRITESVDIMAFDVTQIHFRHTREKLHEFFIPLRDSRAELVAIHIEIIK